MGQNKICCEREMKLIKTLYSWEEWYCDRCGKHIIC